MMPSSSVRLVFIIFLFFFFAAASTPCSLPPVGGPGGLLVSDTALPSDLAVLLPGTEMLQDIKALAARLGEGGEAPFALVRMPREGAAVSADDVNSTDLVSLRGYVERGGLLVVVGGGTVTEFKPTGGVMPGAVGAGYHDDHQTHHTSQLLNAIFGWELQTYQPDWWHLGLAGNVSGTCFGMEEIPALRPVGRHLPNPNPEGGLWPYVEPTKISSLPPEARSIYSK